MPTNTLTMNVRYPGAGKYWIALDGATIEACAPMAGYADVGLADLGRKRLTARAMREKESADSENFASYRLAARAALAQIGEVRSGIFSCCHFHMNTDNGEIDYDLTGPGMDPDFTGRVELRIETPAHLARRAMQASGGRARAASLSPERRSEIAKKAVSARESKRLRPN